MPYRGRVQLGEEVVLGCQCRDYSLTPTLPNLPPLMEIWSSGGTRIISKAIPILDRYVQTGLFHYRQFLGGQFSTGHYNVLYYYTVGSTDRVDQDDFDIIPGGDGDGQVISMYWLEKPHANFIVYQTDAGKLFYGRNPRV